jgi:hypothetical protein
MEFSAVCVSEHGFSFIGLIVFTIGEGESLVGFMDQITYFIDTAFHEYVGFLRGTWCDVVELYELQAALQSYDFIGELVQEVPYEFGMHDRASS